MALWFYVDRLDVQKPQVLNDGFWGIERRGSYIANLLEGWIIEMKVLRKVWGSICEKEVEWRQDCKINEDQEAIGEFLRNGGFRIMGNLREMCSHFMEGQILFREGRSVFWFYCYCLLSPRPPSRTRSADMRTNKILKARTCAPILA